MDGIGNVRVAGICGRIFKIWTDSSKNPGIIGGNRTYQNYN